MRHGYIRDVEWYIDPQEPDFNLRCYHWMIDLYIVTEQPEKALLVKWAKLDYLQKGSQ